jgi:hypothetical protein
VWSSEDVAPEEEIFGDRKFVSYIDLVFINETDRCSFEKHEAFAKDLCQLLVHAPEIAASVELAIRRCYYHQENLACENEIEQSDGPLQQSGNRGTAALGFCVTAYVTGFGDSDHDPVLRWTIGLSLLQYALVQLASH